MTTANNGVQTKSIDFFLFHLHNGQVDHIIRQTMATLRAGSTYSLYSHSVSQMTRAEMMTTTDPRASARTCKNTPCMLRFLVLDFLDGNRTNHAYDNLRMLCFNCSFLINGNLTGPKKEYEY